MCLEAALAIVDPAVRFAVIGMGKLGGRELNYASDVDVLFVHEATGDGRARRAAAAAHDDRADADGIVFRIDADLRPEGRDGPLTRTLERYDGLLGPVGAARGSSRRCSRPGRWPATAALGAAFMAAPTPRVWPDVLEPDASARSAR